MKSSSVFDDANQVRHTTETEAPQPDLRPCPPGGVRKVLKSIFKAILAAVGVVMAWGLLEALREIAGKALAGSLFGG